MSRIRSKDTTPELAVRSSLRAHGVKYRLHRKDLPGHPDIVIPSQKVIIFVHGCFWHRHRCRFGRSKPSTHVAFWQAKFAATRLRDRRAAKALRALGWRVVTVWECSTREPARLAAVLERALTPAR